MDQILSRVIVWKRDRFDAVPIQRNASDPTVVRGTNNFQ